LNDGFETTRFQQGCRESFWTGNCIALGTAAGNVEPLAGTHLASIQAGLMRLLSMFPDKDCSPLLADEYNQLTQQEYRNIRDFLILQYRASQRATSPFWAGYLASPVPSSLEHKIELFNAHGQVAMYEEESFPDTSWASTWLGQDLWPQAYDPILDNYDFQRLQGRFEQMRQIIQQATNAMPSHRDYLGQYCPAVD